MPLTITRTADATVEPITYHEACDHMHVDSDSQQDYITALITAARTHAEDQTQRCFVTSTWALRLDGFPCSSDQIMLPRPPLIAVSSIAYTDIDGAAQTLDSSEYQVDNYSMPGRLSLSPDSLWPQTEYGRRNAVVITYTAGYGATAALVPQPIRQAIKILVAHWFENREPVIAGTIVSPVPMSVDALLGPYRTMEIY